MANPQSPQQKILTVAAIVVVILLAINAFLLYNKYHQDKIIEEQKTELAETDRLKIELEKQYHEALSDLEEMRSNNEELNAIIDQQKADLKQQKDRIEKLILEGRDINRAKAEIANLSAKVSEYLSQIQQLKKEKEAIAKERDILSERSRVLEENLAAKNQQTRELTSKVEELSNEKNKLMAEREHLSETVNFASVIKVTDVIATGMKEKSSGKTVSKRYAKNVDQLRICFKTTQNLVAKPSLERFYVRVITPLGETIAIEEFGAGVFSNRFTGEEFRYTFFKEIDYLSDAKEICHNWDPNGLVFQRGKYKIEIFNKGYLAGSGQFELK